MINSNNQNHLDQSHSSISTSSNNHLEGNLESDNYDISNNSNNNKNPKLNVNSPAPAGITIIPPSPSSIPVSYSSILPKTPEEPIAGSSTSRLIHSNNNTGGVSSKRLDSPKYSPSSINNNGDRERDYFSITTTPITTPSTSPQQHRLDQPSSSTASARQRNQTSPSTTHLNPHSITRSRSHYINRSDPHRQDKEFKIPSLIDTEHTQPHQRPNIDDNPNQTYQNKERSYSITTGSDAHTPTQEYGNVLHHNSSGITRRRTSISTPNNNSFTSPRSRGSSLLKSPPTVPSSSSTLGWLTGNRLTLPPNNKHSTSDDEREEEDDEEEDEDERSKTLHKQKKWDWRMTTSGIPKYGESSGSASGSSGSTINTPFISMTPPSANDYPQMLPPLPIQNSFNISPPRSSILPSQAPLASPSNLHPLPQDPYNILPLSLPSSPFISPSQSRAGTPHTSPHPSLQDLASEYATSASVQHAPSGSGSSPRTSISTSSSRYGWGTGRSDSRSSEDDDLIPPTSPITTSHSHRPMITIPRSGWWQRTLSRENVPVSPKINLSNNNNNNGLSRIIQFPIQNVSSNKFVPTGTRNWGWLFEMVQDKFGFSSSSSSTLKRNENSSIVRKNSISAKSKNRERERLMSGHNRALSHFQNRRKSQNQKVLGSKWLARVMLFVPTEPWSITLFLIFFTAFAVTLTFTLKHILNPDKEALPWRQYCLSNQPTLYSLQDSSLPSPHINSEVSSNPSFPSSLLIESIPFNSFAPSTSKSLTLMPLTPEHPAWPYNPHLKPPFNSEMSIEELDENLNPVGVLIGVFTIDSGIERRHMIRQSYASHWRSRKKGTEGLRIKFVMGRPRKRFEKAVQLEMEAFNDILLLDMDENMNSGKTHAFFSWAAENATVPSWEYPKHSESDGEEQGSMSPIWIGERKPDYVVKADEDSFIMLGELEKRLRVSPRTKAFWGYLVKNTFMAGECYALSFDLVQYIHASPALRTLTRGKEDKLVAKWMNMHPEREQIVWVTEKCWIYDHPRAGTVYSHGFLFPSTVADVRMENTTGLSASSLAIRGGIESSQSYSSVSKFGVPYRPISSDMSVSEQVESLIEGSELSLLRDSSTQSSTHLSSGDIVEQTYSKSSTSSSIQNKISQIYSNKPTRKERFLNDENESGGTVVVHYIKKNEWFIETMIALLGGGSDFDDQNIWHRGVGTGLGMLERRKGRVVNKAPGGKEEMGGSDNVIQVNLDGSVEGEVEGVGEGEAQWGEEGGVKVHKGDGL